MARVREVSPEELTPELRDIWHRYVTGYGPFEEQLAVFAHVPAALRHLMPMLMELRAAGTLPRRYLELAIVVVSKLNACDYCVDHHGPFLAVEGIPTEALEGLPGRIDHPSLTPT
ncbi:MAG: carboxymuconolactone decarboxylase family protein, partial [Alphaproteobacteria bacterium]|nr:carboxymuconolactone decarboxylase family protein [Alphaproteobacteria bacterium]